MGFIRTQLRGERLPGRAVTVTGEADLASRVTSSVVETVSTRLEERIPGIVSQLVDRVIDQLESIIEEDSSKAGPDAVVVTSAKKTDKLGSFASESSSTKKKKTNTKT